MLAVRDDYLSRHEYMALSSVYRCTRELDYFGPLFGVFGDESPEVSGRTRKCSAAKFGKRRLDLWIGQASIDFLVERVDYPGRCARRRAKPEPRARLITRHEFSHGGNIR